MNVGDIIEIDFSKLYFNFDNIGEGNPPERPEGIGIKEILKLKESIRHRRIEDIARMYKYYIERGDIENCETNRRILRYRDHILNIGPEEFFNHPEKLEVIKLGDKFYAGHCNHRLIALYLADIRKIKMKLVEIIPS